jgi:3-hydroxy acid dehydrogenase / malonic semialdehyde reductase
MNKIVFITGATAGIGKATAFKFAQNNYNLILTGRRKANLDTIKKDIESYHKVSVLTLDFDIRNNESVTKAINSHPVEWKNLDILINNAGLAVGMNPVQDGIIDDWERMLDTNIKGLLYISRQVIPLMINNQKGHIINIGSVAGKEVYPGGNVYCATKFAVDALTRGMRLDLIKHNIKVTQVSPGAVKTEFSNVRFKNDSQKAENVYKGYQPLAPEDVAEAVYYVTTLPPHANIQDLTITPQAQANVYVYNRKE